TGEKLRSARGRPMPWQAGVRCPSGRVRGEGSLDQVEDVGPADVGDELALVGIADPAPGGVHRAVVEGGLAGGVRVLGAVDQGDGAVDLAELGRPVLVQELDL